MWNGGRKEEIHGFYWNDSVDDVNRIAIGLWNVLGDPDDSMDRGCEENVDGSRTDPGEPFQGFTTLYGGQASCLITVSPVKYSKENCGKGMDLHYVPTQMYGIVNLKRILKSRQISYKAGDKKDALAKQLHDYLSVWIPATTKEEQQEKDEKEKKDDEREEKDEKDERNFGAPETKRSKLEISAGAE